MAKNNNKKHRLEVYSKSDFKCCFCGMKFTPSDDWNKLDAIYDNNTVLEIDHIKPLSLGGRDIVENKQALCWKCNSIKSNKYPFTKEDYYGRQ